MPKMFDALGEKLGIVKKPVPPPPPTPKPDKVEPKPPVVPFPETSTWGPTDTLVQWAKAQVGKPYSAYRDCSGFTAAAFRQIGVTLPEGSVAQYSVGERINKGSELKPGDLLFWDTFGTPPGHVALYVGSGNVVHALNEQKGIVLSDWQANMGGPYMDARRIPMVGVPGKPEAPAASAGPVGTSASIVFPKGPIKTKGPRGQSLGSWDDLARWEPQITNAVKEAGNAFGPLLLACFSVVESGGNHYTTGKMTGTPSQVVKGGGNPPSVGLLQIVCGYHGNSIPGADCMTPSGQWRIGAKLLTYWMKTEGSWEAALANKWHPGTDPGSGYTPQTYIDTVRKLIAEVKAGWPQEPVPPTTPSRTGNPYAVAGTSKTVILPFPLKQAIIPERQTNQRPGISMSPDRYVQHDTGNRNYGANAVMHKNYLAQGAPDNYGNSQQLSYHFTVDDREAWQMIPVNEVAWHGGDGGGPCNYKGISCELCINADINEPKSRENAEILAAEIMNALGIQSLKKHQDCAGKYCPQDMLNDGYWNKFVQRVTSLRASRK